jgi:hypothetical protein
VLQRHEKRMMNEGCIQYDAPGRLVLMFCYAIEISGLGYIPRQDMKHGIDFAQELPVGWIRRLSTNIR